MRYVLDASVAVAALRKTEPMHKEAFRRCAALFSGDDEIIVPAIFDLEVIAALVRRGSEMTRVIQFFELHFSARRLVTIGPRAVRAARTILGLTQLRAADALYLWVAAREGLPLITADRQLLERASLAGVNCSFP